MTRERQFETASAVVLALATVLTAWSSYQASLWGGEEARGYFEAATANARSAALESQGLQRRTLDAALFVQFATATAAGETTLTRFLYERFRPPLRVATDAWLATRPLVTPGAPRSPFEMPNYVVPEEVEAATVARRGTEALTAARLAEAAADQYVLLTVFFALVLFFSGISGKFEWLALDIATLSAAVVVLLGASIRLFMLPVQ